MPITIKEKLVGKITRKGKLQGEVAIKPIAPILQNKSIEVTQNGVQTIVADEGYNGLNEVEIKTEVLLPSGTINITQNGNTDVKDYVNADVNVQPNLQDKSVEITSNNTTTNISADSGYDGLRNVSVTTNISIDYNAKIIMPTYNQNYKNTCSAFIEDVGEIDFSDISAEGALYLNSFFSEFSRLKSVSLKNTTNIKNFQNFFGSCKELEVAPLFDTSSAINLSYLFYQCNKLKDVPIYDTSKVKNFTYAFSMCGSLTNESLNNILQMCINATSYTGTKTLKEIGIPRSQATTCQSLSNWNDFVAAGWSTGY